jgi:hypothetical protein
MDAHHRKRIGMSGSTTPRLTRTRQSDSQPAVEKAASITTEVLGPIIRPRHLSP